MPRRGLGKQSLALRKKGRNNNESPFGQKRSPADVRTARLSITVGVAADVTSPRLINPDKEPQNWLMVNKDYSSHRYSELDQINKDNVKNLHVAFTSRWEG